MKIKQDFVTNSSSTSFIITNISDEDKSLVDFVMENPEIIIDFIERYKYHEDDEKTYNQENLIKSADQNNIVFIPGDRTPCAFGDEDGTLIGQVFDYMLRDGGRSKSFEWRFDEYLR